MKYGLDFGTTNSAIAIADQGVGRVLEVDERALDKRVIRSMLYFSPRKLMIDSRVSSNRLNAGVFKQGEIYYEGEQKHQIGQAAVEQYLIDNKNRKPGVKRTILTGRIIHNRTLEVVNYANADTSYEHYEEIDYGTGRLLQALKTALKTSFYKGTRVFGKFLTLEDLIEIYISEIKTRADKNMHEVINEVVCGRPVYFSEDPVKDKAAQDRLETALKQIGFDKVSFEFEPVAAAKQFIAYSGNDYKHVLVFDFGGGTLDTAIVKKDGDTTEVLVADGVYIGGDLLNADIFEAMLWDYFGASSHWGETQGPAPRHLYESLKSWYSIPNMNNPDTMALLDRIKYKNTHPMAIDRLIRLITMNLGFELYESIEVAKKELSFSEQTSIVFKDGIIDIDQPMTRKCFEQIIESRVNEIREVVLRALKKANLEPDQIDVVVRTGGSSLIPVFENMLTDIFGREKIKQFETFTSIAAGLAL